MNPGIAGIENELYFAPNTLMLFGDSKVVMGELAKALSGEGGGHVQHLAGGWWIGSWVQDGPCARRVRHQARARAGTAGDAFRLAR